MFCPKCATQNVDGASFCRSCGANISLVPQAISGQLPVANSSPELDRISRRFRRREPSIEEAIRTIIMGVAFVVVAILVSKYAPAGNIWWFWMLIPAATFFSKGISEFARYKRLSNQNQPFVAPQINTIPPHNLSSPRTGELKPPVPSVTEGTTRHLGSEAPTRTFDPLKDQNQS
jgi:hypothetical protein